NRAHHLVVAGTAEDGGATDLVAVQVEDRQHRAVARRVEEAHSFPGTRQRTRLGLAVPDDGHDDQVGIIERRAKGVDEDVAKLTPLVDRAGRRHAHVARDAARRRELAEQTPQAGQVPGDLRVNLRVGSFQVDVRHDRRAPVAGAGQVDHIDPYSWISRLRWT